MLICYKPGFVIMVLADGGVETADLFNKTNRLSTMKVAIIVWSFTRSWQVFLIHYSEEQ